MLWYLLICLAVSLLTLHYYVYTGFHSLSHRLLPLALGMVCLYNFYVTVDYISDFPDVMLVLKRLLMMQILYLVFYYEMDFMRQKPRPWFIAATFTSLIAADGLVIFRFDARQNYSLVTTGFIIVYVLFIFGAAVRGYRGHRFTTIEYKTYGILYIAIFVPAAAMLIVVLTKTKDVILLPGAFSVTCGLIMYLLATNNLEEPRYRLESDYFMKSDIVAVIYDAEYNFLEANAKADREFPELVEKYKDYSLKVWMDNNPGDVDVEYRGKYYRIHVAAVTQRGVVRGYILTSVDVTEEKEKVNAAELETRLKGEFLANMSHDLRSPLHTIIGGSDILLGRNDVFLKNISLVGQIKEAGKQLLEMVNDILDFSKLEKGRLELEHNDFDMDELFINQAHNCITQLKEKPVRFYLKIHDEHPKTLVGDEMRVREIVQNLLSNAVKFTDKGSVSLDVHCLYIRPDKVRLTISVQDTGCGLKEEYRASIFDNYVSYSAGSTMEGTGLGLPIVKKLCEKMGGCIRADSDGRTGTQMTAEIYLDAEADTRREPLSMDSQSVVIAQEDGDVVKPSWTYPAARVLVADDMEVNLRILKEMVKPWQFDLDTVRDGDEAVRAAGENHYDLIILDQMMPAMTGDAAAAEIKKLCDTPLVMMTADITDERKQECLKSGFVAYLAKPVEPEKLKGVIERFLPVQYRSPVTAWHPQPVPKVNYASLKSYEKEVKYIRNHLYEYYSSDLDKFRIKVHGIKGISRQLGKWRTAYHAEIMEMAAKCDNRAFIDEHLQGFMEDLDVTLEMTAVEISNIEEKQAEAGNGIFRMKVADEYIWELLGKLREGFLHYNLTAIEEGLDELKGCHLSEEVDELVKELEEALEDFDYERGLKLLDRK